MISKKNICSLLILLIPCSAHAKWEPGLLLGVSGGYVRDTGLYNVDIYYTGRPDLSNVYFYDGDPDHGLIGGVFAGIQAKKSGWLVGSELHINWVEMDHHRFFVIPDYPGVIDARVWSFDGKVKHGTDYGIIGRVGYAVSSYFLPYMFLGGETSRDDLNVTISGSPDVYPRSAVLYEGKWTYRFTGGVGAEFPVPKTEALSFRLQYMFHLPGTRLQSSNQILDNGVPLGGVPLNPLFSTDIKPKTQSVEVALVWNII